MMGTAHWMGASAREGDFGWSRLRNADGGDDMEEGASMYNEVVVDDKSGVIECRR